MIYQNVHLTKLVFRKNPGLIGVMLFWYLAMFPGSLPFDSSEAIRMIQKNQTIDWWSTTYFWFLRITSFEGKTIALSSALGYLILVMCLSYFLFSIPTLSLVTLRKARLILIATPIVSVFGLTVSHDVFIVSGILLILGSEYRCYKKLISDKQVLSNYLIAGVLLTNTRAFPIFLLGIAVSFTLKRQLKVALIVSVLLMAFYLLSHIGITRDKNYTFIHVLSDLKCVVQHADTNLSREELNFLSEIAPIDRWRNASQCSNIEKIVGDLDPNYEELQWNKNFIANYLRIISKSPAIFLQAKLQRSVVALPPPFFFTIPQNMVSSNLDRPIGLGTNWSLQENGPGVLHPSVDENSVKDRFNGQELIRTPALAGIYLVNQASWFWGWGGLWLWPSLVIPLLLVRKIKIFDLLKINLTLLLLHISIVAIGPAAEARHLAATIIVGISFSLVYVLGKLELRRSLP